MKKQKAKIKFINLKKENNEIRGDILVKSSNITKMKTPSNLYPRTADEYPLLFVIAALTKGVSKFSNIGDLANKEANRITEMQKILKQIGIKSIYSKMN